ncbi:MAG: hypothetical protein LH650_12170 [Chloroflexi bacterium]|nr:hypothetical protein [Chloroflexota bacterium]
MGTLLTVTITGRPVGGMEQVRIFKYRRDAVAHREGDGQLSDLQRADVQPLVYFHPTSAP